MRSSPPNLRISSRVPNIYHYVQRTRGVEWGRLFHGQLIGFIQEDIGYTQRIG